MEDPVVPLGRNLYGHPLAGLLWEKQFEKILLKHGWEKIPNWECLFVHREKGLFLSVYADDIKLAGKKQNTNPMWNLLNKEVDLGEPTSFLDHENLGCTQRQCEISKDIVDNYRTTEKLPFSENLRISSWSYDMGNTAKQYRLGLFQDSDFARDPEDSKSTSGGTLCIFGSHTFVPKSWMCKKHTSVSHSSTESEIISLDAGLRLDGIPALDLWDLVVSVLGNTTQTSERPGRPVITDKSRKSQGKTNVLNNIDCSLKRSVFAPRSFVVCV